MSTPSPRKKLPVNPSLEHLQKQAKRRAKENPTLQLAAVQQQLAREYGCKNWAELARAVATMSQRHDRPVADGKKYEPMPAAARTGAYSGDFTALRRLLYDSNFTRHDLDQSLAHVIWYGPDATWEARKQMADELLDHGADPDGQYGSGGYGPIIFGTAEGAQPEQLLYLIKAGADVTAPPIKTKYGEHCLLSSVLGAYPRGSLDKKHRYIEILLEHGAYVPAEVTPLLLAIHRGRVAELGDLLDRAPSLVTQTFPDMPYGNMILRGATLLHCAVEFGENECIGELLQRKADLNARAELIGGVGGQTPIFHTIATICDGNFPTLEYLAKVGGPAIDMTVRATFRRFDKTPPQSVTPLEFAEEALRTDDKSWHSRAEEELALLRALTRK